MFCPSCNEENDDGAVTCCGCGSPLGKRPMKRGLVMLVTAIVGALVVILIVLAISFLG